MALLFWNAFELYSFQSQLFVIAVLNADIKTYYQKRRTHHNLNMNKNQKEAILLSSLNEKDKYRRLAEYILKLMKYDPLMPKESLHTIIYRIKDESRLKHRNIDLINALNPSIFWDLQGKKVAHEGLRNVLKWRKNSSSC
jgi:hypothetical protein